MRYSFVFNAAGKAKLIQVEGKCRMMVSEHILYYTLYIGWYTDCTVLLASDLIMIVIHIISSYTYNVHTFVVYVRHKMCHIHCTYACASHIIMYIT